MVGILGTTEESSVDPIKDIINLREEYRRRGLNFWLHADGAWGGYYRTMLNVPKPVALSSIANVVDQYVPAFGLNDYTHTQLDALPGVDSVTLDPHKSGYVQYPAGALAYRNIDFRTFVTVSAPVVFHGGTDPTVGIYGIEGSKPGAAPTAVLLANRVIGLDENGYGRILGQAMYGAKLFHAMWLTVAKPEDPFECFHLKPLPDDCFNDGCDIDKVKKFIREKIVGKTNAYIFSQGDVLEFLHKIGPDTSINAFACNFKLEGMSEMNKDIAKANEFNDCLFDQMSYTNLKRDVKRVGLMLTSSKKDPAKFGISLTTFKSKMGLKDPGGSELVHFLINTVMNPLQSSEGHITSISEHFRDNALICRGKMTDHKGYHGFVVAGQIEKDGTFYGDHLSVFSNPKHQYQAIVRFQLENKELREEINRELEKNNTKPIIILNKLKWKGPNLDVLDFDGGLKLHDIVFQIGGKRNITYVIFHGFENLPNHPFKNDVEIHTHDVVYFKHFYHSEKASQLHEHLPVKDGILRYFLYGSQHQSFVSKINDGRFPDIHHIQELHHNDTRPPFSTEDLLHGIELKIVHPRNRFLDKHHWISPFYVPSQYSNNMLSDSCGIKPDVTNKKSIKSKYNEYCEVAMPYVMRATSCLTSLKKVGQFKHDPIIIEFARGFKKSKISDIPTRTSVIYSYRTIWFDTDEINKGLTGMYTFPFAVSTIVREFNKRVLLAVQLVKLYDFSL